MYGVYVCMCVCVCVGTQGRENAARGHGQRALGLLPELPSLPLLDAYSRETNRAD